MGAILGLGGSQFVNAVDSLQSSLTNVEGELSSGLAVRSASDAPDQVSEILQLHAEIAQNSQIKTNLTAAQGVAQTADSSLQTAGTVLNQVATLASEGLGASETATTRQTLANQVSTLLSQMVSISNTTVDGSYIFSGDASQSPSYNYDSTTGTVQRLQTTNATQQVQDGSGGTFAVGLTANQIFDARDSNDQPISGENVFSAISEVVSALNSNDTSALQTAVGDVQSASTYLNTQQAFYGNVEDQISAALTNVGNLATSYQTDLSNRADADESTAILEMQQYTTTLQAALAAQEKMPTQTLFDLMQG